MELKTGHKVQFANHPRWSWRKLFVFSIAAMLAGPFIPLALHSVAFQWNWPSLLPDEWWWDVRETKRIPISWDYIFSPYSNVLEATANTLAIALAASLISLAICLPAARVLAEKHFPSKNLIINFFDLPLFLPEIAFALPLLALMIQFDIAGTYTGIIFAHIAPTIPYMLRIITATQKIIGIEAEEQARILGASRTRIAFQITIPMLLPGIIIGCLFAFLVSSNIFLLTFLIGQGAVETLPTLLFTRISGGALDSIAAGLSIVSSLPGIILLINFDRLTTAYKAQRR